MKRFFIIVSLIFSIGQSYSQVIVPEPKGYIDLGLPSGTKWKNENEKGFYNFNDAVLQFSNRIPTIEQWQELYEYCKWSLSTNHDGWTITGRNGNAIFIPFAGQKWDGKIQDVGHWGFYWSSSQCGNKVHGVLLGSPLSVRNFSHQFERIMGASVRLVRQ